MYSPLEQFEISPFLVVLTFWFSVVDLSLTIFFLIFLIAVGLFVVSFLLGTYESKIIPTGAQFFIENVYLFLFNLLGQQVGFKKMEFFPLVLTIFVSIVLLNVLGLVPYSFTVTSSIIVTFHLAFSFNLGFLLLGISLHGFWFLRLFVPGGVPLLLCPLIFLIELLSYLIRSFSLSLRLFANMMAGHTLLQILAGFVKSFLLLFSFWSLFFFLPFFLVLFVFFLEVGICLLQAYVFSVLSCIYYNDAVNLH